MGQWNDIYNEILAYYFWEPQHLGKVKNLKSSINTYQQLIEHNKKLEVSLNHQLSLFFSLAPKSFIQEFFSKAFSTTINDDFVFDSSNMNSVITELKDLTQPDFFFVGEKNIVAMEMKINAKTNLDQYMKYLLFNLLYQKKIGTNKQFWLLFLTKDASKSVWKEKFQSHNTAKSEFLNYLFPVKSKKGNINIYLLKSRLLEASSQTTVETTTYRTLYDLMSDELRKSNSPYSPLFLGMIDELESRGLC